MQSKYLKVQSVNAGSMADIAFLLLIFFLVTTTILQDKGLMLQLPPKAEDRTTAPVNERNLFKVLVNSDNQFLIQGEVRNDLSGLRQELKSFILNAGVDPKLSDSPQKAVISIKTNRGTEYGYFIELLDEVKGAYYEIYADRAGLSVEQYKALDLDDPTQRHIQARAKEGIPMNISLAEPNQNTSSL